MRDGQTPILWTIPHSQRVMMAEADRIALIRCALEKRLDHVKGHLHGAPPLMELDFENHRCEEPEETLRLLMVRYLPKVKQGKATERDQVKILTLILELSEVALTDDLRFLDAWNTIYEIFCENDSLLQEAKSLETPFLPYYAFLLQSYIQKLK